MKYNTTPDSQPDFSWGHLFIIAVVVALSYVTAVRCGIVRVGKQQPVKYSEIDVKGFQR